MQEKKTDCLWFRATKLVPGYIEEHAAAITLLVFRTNSMTESAAVITLDAIT